MKSVVLLLCVVIQLSSAQYGRPRPIWTTVRPATNFEFKYESSYEAALARANEEGKPIMVLSHLTNCKACKNLMPSIASSQVIPGLADNFVVIHSLDGSDSTVDSLGPSNHRYYPRVFFYGRNGRIIPGISNTNQPRYPYYYSNEAELAKSMKDVINSNKY